ncbi:MAG: hypothetical protein ACRC6R_08880, partial [Bacteroidales bacterium]
KLRDIIVNTTLPMFSKFHRLQVILNYIDINKLVHVEKTNYRKVVKLPPEFVADINSVKSRLLGVKRIQEANVNSVYGQSSAAYYTDFRAKSLIGHMYAHESRNSNFRHLPVKFVEPDLLVFENHIYNQLNNMFDMTLYIQHPDNLSTISETNRYYFEKLAKLDIMIALYENELKFLRIDQGIGTIDLQLDRFSTAAGEREELLELLKDLAQTEQPMVYRF